MINILTNLVKYEDFIEGNFNDIFFSCIEKNYTMRVLVQGNQNKTAVQNLHEQGFEAGAPRFSSVWPLRLTLLLDKTKKWR